MRNLANVHATTSSNPSPVFTRALLAGCARCGSVPGKAGWLSAVRYTQNAQNGFGQQQRRDGNGWMDDAHAAAAAAAAARARQTSMPTTQPPASAHAPRNRRPRFILT
ncbi:hypothetical protein JDV02_010848 [Purpureocillium takamizusanense]|uniref:Uncharacterized protein n=1 Tax=Purpureocillium takamizusanense TaxID=2060973 RepID=A0A9Q8QDC2_9HYPO|nr:uncharacterized protein JDV02_010848 [Purpureocillium takamizusanense]UNI17187.1 hypothetical protein JDV02_010848 [Purpureocillium takamizusanense]